ncbi:MAG: UvrD-helicase domain-containing protein [Polyangiales bacterium]
MGETKLNPAQREAVEHVDGPLLVLAGAGSGKTGVITRRIARLVKLGHKPETILAVSFTNKAAAEMAERMVPLIGAENTKKLWLSTFHSFGVRFLHEENRHLGYDGRFVIFDQGDVTGLIRELMREIAPDRNLDLQSIVSRISLWKNAFVMPEDVKPSDFEYDAVAREIYPRYQAALARMHAVDFDDLVVAPVRILQDNERVREKWRNRFRFLMIDEFQDTNKSQLELVRLLANEQHNIAVVGDDDQSIYGWRGAEVGNILDFERLFPGTRVVKLELNYRSRSPILDVANAAIGQSRGKRHGKTLRSVKGDGPKVRVVALGDSGEEAKFVGREIRELVKGGEASPDGRPHPYKSIAVLYRSNQTAKILEEELRLGGIPYRVFGGTQFFDRKEVKDLVAYLRVVDNPRDELSLRRILDVPPRGVGEGSLAKVEALRTRKGLTLERALREASFGNDIPERGRRGLQQLFQTIDDARRGLQDKQSIVRTTERLYSQSGFEGMLAGDTSVQGQRRRENVSFLLRSLQRFEEAQRGITLGQFLTRLMLQVRRARQERKKTHATS